MTKSFDSLATRLLNILVQKQSSTIIEPTLKLNRFIEAHPQTCIDCKQKCAQCENCGITSSLCCARCITESGCELEPFCNACEAKQAADHAADLHCQNVVSTTVECNTFIDANEDICVGCRELPCAKCEDCLQGSSLFCSNCILKSGSEPESLCNECDAK
jgi:hypothetical protein